MKFTVSLQANKIKSLFRFPCDFINVYVRENIVIFFAETADIFSCTILAISTLFDYEAPVLFRIPKNGFLGLLEDGVVRFLCSEESIYVQIETKNVASMLKFDRQICSIQSLEENLKAISNVENYPLFPAGDLVLACRLLRTSSYPITIENHFAFSSVGNLQLYSKTKCRDCAVFPIAFNFLVGCCDSFDRIFDVKNTIIYSYNDSHVIIKKAISLKSSDINYILKQKVTYRVSVLFQNALHLLAKVKDYTDIDLNLRRQELIIHTSNCEYSTKIKLISDEKQEVPIEQLLNSPVEEIPIIRFPSEVFRSIIFAARSKELKIACTKRLVRVTVAEGLMFVSRK